MAASVLARPDAQLISENGGYRCGNLLVLPLQGPGADVFLAKAYLQFAAEKTLPSIFYERVRSLTEFLNWGLDKNNIFLGAFLGAPGDEAGTRFCGISWINKPVAMGGDKTKSEIGMGFFRHTPALPFGRLMLHWLFDHLDLDVLFGTTPVQNQLAIRYSKRLGFDVSTTLKDYTTWEGQLTAVTISRLSREMWDVRKLRGEA